MRRKLITVLAAVAMFASLVAAPAVASTDKPIRGHMDCTLNTGYLEQGVAQDVSWYGTIRIKGKTYPVVYYGDLLDFDGDFLYWEDRYEILASLSYEVSDTGVITAFEPGEVILEVVERGLGYAGWFVAIGSVEEASGSADPYGRLGGVSTGDAMVYWGYGVGNDFTASLRILATG